MGAAVTPGQEAHDTWCGLGDWDELDDETQAFWENAVKKHAAAQAAVDARGGER